jgi:transposase
MGKKRIAERLGIVPDNLKSAVIKASKYEPQLNENLSAIAQHYGCSILPARVRRPQDKAHVENMVKIIYRHVHAALPPDRVFTLEELNSFIRERIHLLNDAVLTGKNYSRSDRLMMETESLQPLRDDPFELRKIKLATVQKNYHVLLLEDQHYYSVPYQLIGKKLRLSYTGTQVHIYHNYEPVASYPRNRIPHRYTTQKEHMPASHAAVAGWNPNYFLERGRAIDPVVEAYISKVLDGREHPETTYRSCNGILSFLARVGRERLINACRVGMNLQAFGYNIIAGILKKNMDKMMEEEIKNNMPQHENIRGADYYK